MDIIDRFADKINTRRTERGIEAAPRSKPQPAPQPPPRQTARPAPQSTTQTAPQTARKQDSQPGPILTRSESSFPAPALVDNEPDITSAAAASRRFRMNFAALASQGCLTPDDRKSRISEELRLIKRRLMQRMTLCRRNDQRRGLAARRGREHVMLVTSAKPNEGKSFMAVNLALSIVIDEGLNVLLIDGDAARPSLSRLFGLRDDLPGLTDLLTGNVPEMSDALLRARELPLSFLPAGGAVDSATDLFAGEYMRLLTREMSERYTDRIVIIDAPPLLASTEPVALAEHAGQIIFVIDAEKTSRAAVESALDLLDMDQNVNLVLNKTPVRNRTEQFGSYYDAYSQKS